MDESELTSSHDLNGSPNAEAPPEMQNRAYGPEIVRKGASELNAEDLLDPGNVGETGRPVVTRWNGKLLVLSGNHRINMIRQAMREYPQNAARYLETLRNEAQGFGVDPARVGGKSVLVREIEPPKSLEEMKQLVADLNERRTQSFSRTTDMANRATNVTPRTMELVSSAMERLGDKGTIKAMLDGADGESLVRQLVSDGVLPHTELPSFVENGKLTPAGKAAVEGAITGKILGGVPAEPGILNKLVTAAGTIARAEASAPDFKIGEKVRQAAKLLSEAGDKPIERYLSEGQLKEGMDPNAAPETVRPPRPTDEIIRLAGDMKKLGPQVFTKWLREQVDKLAKPADLFGGGERVTEYQARPAKSKLRSNGAQVRDQETGAWRDYDPAKDGPAPTMKDSGPRPERLDPEGDGGTDWRNPGVKERLTEAKKNPPPPPVDRSAPKPGGDWEKYVREFKSEEEITPQDTTPTDVRTASVIETTDGYARKTGATSVLAEGGISFEKMASKDFELMGGNEMIDKIERLVEDHPGGDLVVSKMARGVALDAADQAVFDKAPAEFTKFAREFRNFLDMVRAHDIPLREAAEAKRAQADQLDPGDSKYRELMDEAKALEEERYAIGDLGPGYFPWRNLTWESMLKIVERYGVEEGYDRIMKGNLDYSREGVVEPLSNSVTTAKNYVKSVRSKMTDVQVGKKLKAAAAQARSMKWSTAAKIFDNLYESHVKRVVSSIDKAEFVKRIERMARDPEYRAKFKDVVADRAPVSSLANLHNAVVGHMLVAFNLSSSLTAGISNVARVASEMGLKRFAEASTEALDYFMSDAASRFSGVKLDPKMKALREQVQRMAGLEDAELADITGQESGMELGGKYLKKIRQAAYQGVRIPDVVAKFIAVIDQLKAVSEENPSWSKQKVETEAAIRVAGMTDVSKGWSRPQVANNPIYKIGTLFMKSSIRETTQMIRQLNGGPSGWAKLAKNFGIRASAWALVYKLTSGSFDKDKILGALARVLPFSFLWENKAPPAGIIAQKIYKAATGEPEALVPAAFQQKGFRRLFKKEKKNGQH